MEHGHDIGSEMQPVEDGIGGELLPISHTLVQAERGGWSHRAPGTGQVKQRQTPKPTTHSKVRRR